MAFSGKWNLLAVLIFFVISCGPSQRGLFGDKTPHARYGDKIKDAGLDKTAMGSLWFTAADKSLSQPANISLPYKETGYFSADEPRATGYLFDAERGATVNISVNTIPSNTRLIFAELWRPGEDAGKSKLLAAADSSLIMKYEIEKAGKYIIRLQPELLQGMEYTITISNSPSLAFPVSDVGKPRMISFWAAQRDGGARSHEGVDISAKFRTPAIAAADGYVQRVTNNNLGGKVVFMRPEGRDYALYYAHLDSQIVSNGQHVKTGDVIGLVGNTGNAKNTVPHLHFGIYASGGAVDPLPFINPTIAKAKEVKSSTDNLNKWLRTTAASNIYQLPGVKSPVVYKAQAGAALKIIAATDDFYKVVLPDLRQGFIKNTSVTSKIVRVHRTDTVARLLEQPSPFAAAKLLLAGNTGINIIGSYNNYYLAEYNSVRGWLDKSSF